MAQESFDIIIADKLLESRMQLKAATASAPQFDHCSLASSLGESLRLLNERRTCDIVFISQHFESAAISEFIKEARQTPAGRDAAYIMVIGVADQTSVGIAENVLIGADGFLSAPYSVDSLVEITRLASTVKRQRMRERQEAAVKMIVTDLIRAFDRVSLSKYLGQQPGEKMREFKDVCATVKALDSEWQQVYFTELISQTEKLSPPIRPELPKSKRAQEKLKKKIENAEKTGMQIRIIRG
ncbi:MAG: hypothetical protein K1X79_10185 [Oligoflexia bacterium]|nr:hypothetical protein [Oligoflexia bacterium]